MRRQQAGYNGEVRGFSQVDGVSRRLVVQMTLQQVGQPAAEVVQLVSVLGVGDGRVEHGKGVGC